jgi:hypothetical protein
MAAVSRNQIIIVSLGGLGVALAVFLAVTLKEKKPADLPPPAKGNVNGGAGNATNTPAPIRTNAPVAPSTNSPPAVPPTPTGDPLLRALQQKGNLKTALESLAVDHGFDAEGNLLWLGLGSLAVTDEALAKLADEKKMHALYLYDTKITDAGLKHLAGLTGLRLLLLTATPVTVSGVAELEAVLPECLVVR